MGGIKDTGSSCGGLPELGVLRLEKELRRMGDPGPFEAGLDSLLRSLGDFQEKCSGGQDVEVGSDDGALC